MSVSLILDTYSLFPYSSQYKDQPRHLLERMRKYVLAFKYARGDDGTGRDFDEIVEDLARQGWSCPAFDGDVTIVPVPPLDVPKSGGRNGAARIDPNWRLAQALAQRLPGARAAQLWERTASVGWVEDSAPPTLADHRASLRPIAAALPTSERVVLVHDLITRGTEVFACALALRDAGYTGSLSAFVVAQATGRRPGALQLESCLVHHIEGAATGNYPNRHDDRIWCDLDARFEPDDH
jgi:predicted amidophosphoribosyltransferase